MLNTKFTKKKGGMHNCMDKSTARHQFCCRVFRQKSKAWELWFMRLSEQIEAGVSSNQGTAMVFYFVFFFCLSGPLCNIFFFSLRVSPDSEWFFGYFTRIYTSLLRAERCIIWCVISSCFIIANKIRKRVGSMILKECRSHFAIRRALRCCKLVKTVRLCLSEMRALPYSNSHSARYRSWKWSWRALTFAQWAVWKTEVEQFSDNGSFSATNLYLSGAYGALRRAVPFEHLIKREIAAPMGKTTLLRVWRWAICATKAHGSIVITSSVSIDVKKENVITCIRPPP